MVSIGFRGVARNNQLVFDHTVKYLSSSEVCEENHKETEWFWFFDPQILFNDSKSLMVHVLNQINCFSLNKMNVFSD